MAAPRPAEIAPPQPRPAAAHEQEERRSEQDREAGGAGQAEQQPGEELTAVDARPKIADRRRHPAPAEPGAPGIGRRGWLGFGLRQIVLVGSRLRIGAEGDPHREQGQADGKDVGLVPRRADLGGVPEHRSEGQEERRREADPASDRQAPEHPPGDPDVDRADDGEDELPVGVVSPCSDEREQQDRRQRRERDVAARHAVVRRYLPDVVEEGVAGRSVGGLDRVPDRGLAFEERLGLPLEVVVEPERLVVRVDDQGDRDEGESDGRRRQRRPRRAAAPSCHRDDACRVRFGLLRSTLCYPAIHLRMLVQEASLR